MSIRKNVMALNLICMLLWLTAAEVSAADRQIASPGDRAKMRTEAGDRSFDQGFLPPELLIDPNALESRLITGESEEFILNLRNTGEEALSFFIQQ